jgi:hypothetical protein
MSLQYSRVILDHEPGYPGINPFVETGLKEFRRGLEEALSSSMIVEDADARHMTTPFPWLDVLLFFASTTVATTMLNKIGEDVYNYFKGKVVKSIGDGSKDGKHDKQEILVERLEVLKAGITPTDELARSILSLRGKASSDSGNQPPEYYINFRIDIEIGEILQLKGKVKTDDYEVVIDAIKGLPQMLTSSEPQQDSQKTDTNTQPQQYVYEYDTSKKLWIQKSNDAN